MRAGVIPLGSEQPRCFSGVGFTSKRYDLEPAVLIVDASIPKHGLSRSEPGRLKHRPNGLEQRLDIGPVEIDLRRALTELVAIDLTGTRWFKDFSKLMRQFVDRTSFQLGAEPVAREGDFKNTAGGANGRIAMGGPSRPPGDRRPLARAKRPGAGPRSSLSAGGLLLPKNSIRKRGESVYKQAQETVLHLPRRSPDQPRGIHPRVSPEIIQPRRSATVNNRESSIGIGTR